MDPPVVFSFSTFTGLFPEFSGLTQGQATAYFTRATGSMIANSCSNPANNDGNLSYLIYLVTAHVAWLNCPKDTNGQPTGPSGTPSTDQVGRVSNATQGSVSVTLDWPGSDPTAQEKYFAQTKYGAEYWAATAQYRTARYLARPTRVAGTGRFLGGLSSPWGWR